MKNKRDIKKLKKIILIIIIYFINRDINSALLGFGFNLFTRLVEKGVAEIYCILFGVLFYVLAIINDVVAYLIYKKIRDKFII